MNLEAETKRLVISQDLKKYALLLMIGFSLGIDKFYSKFTPFPFLTAVPIFSFAATIYIVTQWKTIEWNTRISKIILFLTAYGFALGITRYYLFYAEQNLQVLPVFRHTIGMILGLTSFLAIKQITRTVNLSVIVKMIILSSIPSLLMGTFQLLTGQKVGYFTRAIAFFSEPSYYGDYLVLLLAPCLIHTLANFKTFELKLKLLLLTYSSVLVINLVGTQSGTAIIKTVVLLFLIFLFFPIRKKYKLFLCIGLPAVFLISAVLLQGYTYKIGLFVLEIFSNPDIFFKHQTIYDRFYPIYAAFRNLFPLSGFFGLGFAGDYFEFVNLYPESTHYIMRSDKPSLSFFNSYASKIILFFGIFGVAWMFYLFQKAFKIINPVLKIGFFSILITSFWGVSSFALPYLWFWLALVENEPSSFENEMPQPSN